MNSSPVSIVIPCYNEEKRLPVSSVRQLLEEGFDVLLVNDGSKDGTLGLLEELRDSLGVGVLNLERNGGKAEAVRRGLLHAAQSGAGIVGYADADFATPVSDMVRLREAMTDSKDVVLGARVARLGANIDRKVLRHYFGRVFATGASAVLGAQIYDTQCGAKLFRVNQALTASIATPFQSNWAFDVELLARLLDEGIPTDRMVEVPLQEWTDVAGSKVSIMGMVRAAVDLVRIARARNPR